MGARSAAQDPGHAAGLGVDDISAVEESLTPPSVPA